MLVKAKILFYELAKCVERVATSLKHTFSSLRVHRQFDFNFKCIHRSNGLVCPMHGPFCH